MKPEEEKKKEEEIDRIYQIVLEAIPTDVAMVDIAIALNRLAAEFIWQLTDDEDDDSEEDDDTTLLPDTSFSVN